MTNWRRDRYAAPHLADLKVLLAIAETGSNAAAARKLGLTSAAVGARLHRLYLERGIPSGSSAAYAVWRLRGEMEAISTDVQRLHERVVAEGG